MNFLTDFSPWIISAMTGLAFLKYPLLTLGALIEGPILMIACGFLLHYNFFNLAAVFLALVLGDLIGDLIWYYVGQKFADRFLINYGRYFGVSLESFEKAKTLFFKYHIKILVISKLTMGFGMAIVTLMVAGATRVPFKKYFMINFFGELVLTAMLMSIGYLFGELYKYIAEGFKVAFLIGIFIIAILVITGLTRFVRYTLLRVDR